MCSGEIFWWGLYHSCYRFSSHQYVLSLEYALFQPSHSFALHALVYIWWYDRHGAIQSSGINFLKDLPRFLTLLIAFQHISLKDWGINENFWGASDGEIFIIPVSPTVSVIVNTGDFVYDRVSLVGHGSKVLSNTETSAPITRCMTRTAKRECWQISILPLSIIPDLAPANAPGSCHSWCSIFLWLRQKWRGTSSTSTDMIASLLRGYFYGSAAVIKMEYSSRNHTSKLGLLEITSFISRKRVRLFLTQRIGRARHISWHGKLLRSFAVIR